MKKMQEVEKNIDVSISATETVRGTTYKHLKVLFTVLDHCARRHSVNQGEAVNTHY